MLKYTPWTTEELEMLKILRLEQELPYKEIAKTLGRDITSCHNAAIRYFKLELQEKARVRIFISGNVPSSKNSKRWTGRRLINSETVMKYKKNTADEWWQEGIKFREMLKGKKKPYKIGFYFIRNSKRAFDYVNVAQLPLDLMQENEWIENDNMENVIPVFLGYEVDKRNAGVRIEIL